MSGAASGAAAYPEGRGDNEQHACDRRRPDSSWNYPLSGLLMMPTICSAGGPDDRLS